MPGAGGRSGGNIEQSGGGDGWLCLRFAHANRISAPSREALSFSTGHPPSVIASCQAAFTLLDSPEGERLIRKLWANTKFFQKRLRKLGFSTGASQTPITPILVGEAAKAFEFSRLLFEAGVFAPAGLSHRAGRQGASARHRDCHTYACRPSPGLRHDGRGRATAGNCFVASRAERGSALA